MAQAKYKGVARILSRIRDPLDKPEHLIEALADGDSFIMANSSYEWTGEWVDPRWKKAALKRKEEEEERSLKIEQEIAEEARAYFDSKDGPVFDYTESESDEVNVRTLLESDGGSDVEFHYQNSGSDSSQVLGDDPTPKASNSEDRQPRSPFKEPSASPGEFIDSPFAPHSS